jgi:hypothetical protein
MLATEAPDFPRRYTIPNELTASAAVLAAGRVGWIGPEACWEAVLWAAARARAVVLGLVGTANLRNRIIPPATVLLVRPTPHRQYATH